MNKQLKTLLVIWCLVVAYGQGLLAKDLTVVYHQDQKEVQVKNFNTVLAGGPIQVIITLGTKESLSFEGDKEAIASLVGEVKGSALIIRPEMSWSSWAQKYKGKTIIAHVTAKSIHALSLSGNGEILVKGTLDDDELSINLSGSGVVRANINCNMLTAVLSGSGKLKLNGDADAAKVTISGSASLGSDKRLNITHLNAVISGSGNIRVHSEGSIKAFVSGTGKVYYTGKADVSEKVLMGRGGVEQVQE